MRHSRALLDMEISINGKDANRGAFNDVFVELLEIGKIPVRLQVAANQVHAEPEIANGLIEPGRDRVTVNGNPVARTERQLYILFNKPKDCITTLSDERGRMTVMDYVKVKERIYPIGRLDRNTTGVLLLTNDGDLAQALTHPKHEIERVYRARLERGILDEDMNKLRRGVKLEDGISKPERTDVVPGTKRTEIYLSLREGKNREVRRMIEALGYDVKGLERIAFAGLTTQGVPRGRWRNLTRSEVNHLRQQAEV